jgi:uncharacterized membrane protein
MVFCVYLIYLHYQPNEGSFCNIATGFNCEIVNKSSWSYMQFGSVKIPVAIMGFLTYLILFLGSFGLMKDWKFDKILPFLKAKMIVFLMILLSAIGMGFSLYLTYIEAFVLYNYCIFCLGQQILIILIFGFLLSAIGKLEKII